MAALLFIRPHVHDALRRTIAHPVTATGTALHAGVPVTMTLAPAAGRAAASCFRAQRSGHAIFPPATTW